MARTPVIYDIDLLASVGYMSDVVSLAFYAIDVEYAPGSFSIRTTTAT